MREIIKELPSNNSFAVEWYYAEEIPEISDDQYKYIKENLDPFVIERNNVKLFLYDFFINHFILSNKKFNILKKINNEIDIKIKNKEYPSDVVMLMLYEDSIKYCAISFSEIIKKLIVFINGELKGKYLPLLRRNGLNLIVKRMSEANSPRLEEYKKRLMEYHATWDKFFKSGTNSKNGPKNEDLEALKKKLEITSQKLKAYRNKVAAHFDDEVPKKVIFSILSWSELENIILHVQEFFQDFHFLLTYANIQCDQIDGIGFTSEETTVKSYITGIFQTFNN